jgi:hypothetical protein
LAYVGKAPQSGRYSILDDISGSFTGSTAGPFNLTVNGSAISPQNEANVIISISGVIQEPQTAYVITNNQITFTSNPSATDTFFGTVLGDVYDIGTPSDGSVSAGSLGSTFFVKNNQTWSDINMTGSNNGALVGPVTVSGTITIPSGSTFVIL